MLGAVDYIADVDARGIFPGMKSYDNSDMVVEALGEKVIQALGAAITRTRLDLDRYRPPPPPSGPL